jgi:hypothetical protein
MIGTFGHRAYDRATTLSGSEKEAARVPGVTRSTADPPVIIFEAPSASGN